MSDMGLRRTGLSQSANWHRWQPQELSGRNDAAGAEATPIDELPQPGAEEQHQRAREQAWNEGYSEGRQQGREDGFQSGYEEGFEQGLTEGRNKAREEAEQALRETLAPLTELLKQADAAMEQMKNEIASDLVNLSIAAGQQLARSVLDEAPEQVGQLIRELLHADEISQEKAKLWLHPEDAALVQGELGPELERANWELQLDETLSRGGCRLTSPYGELDATWEARCEQLWSQIRRRRERPAAAAAKAIDNGSGNP